MAADRPRRLGDVPLQLPRRGAQRPRGTAPASAAILADDEVAPPVARRARPGRARAGRRGGDDRPQPRRGAEREDVRGVGDRRRAARSRPACSRAATRRSSCSNEPVGTGAIVAVTLEPEGGSDQPTTDVLFGTSADVSEPREPLRVLPGRQGSRRPRARTAFRRGAAGAHRHAGRRSRARRALRPLREGRVRPGVSRSPELVARRGRGAGGVPHGVADGRHVHPRARQTEHLAPHASSIDARSTSCGASSGGAQPEIGRNEPRLRTSPAAEEEVTLRDRRRAVQAALRQLPPRPAGGDRARVLRRAHAVGARPAARRAPRHRQEPDVRRGAAQARRYAPGSRASSPSLSCRPRSSPACRRRSSRSSSCRPARCG